MTGEQKIKKALKVIGDTAGQDILMVIGTNGTIWKVSDTLTGELLGIRDISGFSCFTVDSDGRVTVGNGTNPTSSMFTAFSTTQGSTPVPKMTTAQKNAIASPVEGLYVYQIDGTAGLYQYTSGVWRLQVIANGTAVQFLKGDGTLDSTIYENTVNKVSTIVGAETDTTKYPNNKALADYVTLKLPTSYSKIVYIDTVNPNTATIFDLNNPPTVNDDSLKIDVNNLYIGTDTSTWVYNAGTSSYVTKAAPTSISNFYLGGTTTDAGNNKSGAIERTGTVGGAPATASNHFVTKAQLDLKSNISITTNIQTGTTYTLVASDLGKQIVFTNAAGITVTIPSGLPSGFNTEVLQQGTGQITFVGSATTLKYSTFELPTTTEQYSVVCIDNMSNLTETYHLFGQLTSI